MTVECSSCRNQIEIVDTSPDVEVVCPWCGKKLQCVNGEAPTDASAEQRQHGRFSGDRHSVTMRCPGSVNLLNGKLVDESFGGIAVRFSDDVDLMFGQVVELECKDVKSAAVVRNLSRSNDGSLRVGFEWQTTDAV